MDNPKGLSAVESKLAKEVVSESSKLKTLGSWVKGDVYFGGADMLNNWSKGQGFLRGLNNAVEQATLGAIDVEADENALSKLIGEQGSKEDQEAFGDYLDASKKFNTFSKFSSLPCSERISIQRSPVMLEPGIGINI